jgi:hypothetical protein
MRRTLTDGEAFLTHGVSRKAKLLAAFDEIVQIPQAPFLNHKPVMGVLNVISYIWVPGDVLAIDSVLAWSPARKMKTHREVSRAGCRSSIGDRGKKLCAGAHAAFFVPRMYAQSTSGRRSSQVTFPLVSRSMLIQRLSPALFPYATLRNIPYVVSQRSAKALRSSIVFNVLRKSLRVMMQSIHRMVSINQHHLGNSPNGC